MRARNIANPHIIAIEFTLEDAEGVLAFLYDKLPKSESEGTWFSVQSKAGLLCVTLRDQIVQHKAPKGL